MIRYISQKEVDSNGDPLLKKYHSMQKDLNKNKPTIEVPQVIDNSSNALKSLKRINDHRDMMKGRLSVLQIHQQKNDNRALLNEQKYQFHRQMRDELSRERQEKAQHLKRMLQQIHDAQQQAKSDRRQHELNLKMAQQQLNQSKTNDYKMTKQQREEFQKNISEFRQQQSEYKHGNKQKVRNFQNKQKQSVILYMKSKQMEVKLNESLQSQKLGRVKEERVRQIQELSKLQSMMIEKHSRSKMSSQQSQLKLKQLLSKGKSVSTSHSTKLPSIGQGKRQNSEQDILIL